MGGIFKLKSKHTRETRRQTHKITRDDPEMYWEKLSTETAVCMRKGNMKVEKFSCAISNVSNSTQLLGRQSFAIVSYSKIAFYWMITIKIVEFKLKITRVTRTKNYFNGVNNSFIRLRSLTFSNITLFFFVCRDCKYNDPKNSYFIP
jgi:hypothetical protein